MSHGITEWEAREMNEPFLKAREDRHERRRVRIQALGAAISRKDWHAVSVAYIAIRDAFDRPEIHDRLIRDAVAVTPLTDETDK